jgi:hypothetical protein
VRKFVIFAMREFREPLNYQITLSLQSANKNSKRNRNERQFYDFSFLISDKSKTIFTFFRPGMYKKSKVG